VHGESSKTIHLRPRPRRCRPPCSFHVRREATATKLSTWTCASSRRLVWPASTASRLPVEQPLREHRGRRSASTRGRGARNRRARRGRSARAKGPGADADSPATGSTAGEVGHRRWHEVGQPAHELVADHEPAVAAVAANTFARAALEQLDLLG
jgi:hypothetical protein